MSEAIGIIAGESVLPLLSAREARKKGLRAIVAGIRSVTEGEVAREADAYQEFSLGQIGRAIRYLKSEGVVRAVMVGRVPHPAIYQLFSMDRKFLSLLRRIRERTTTSLLSAVADFLSEEGITIIDSTYLLKDLLARAANYVPSVRVGRELAADIDFGWEKAWGIARLDIGQTVCVKNRAVVAVEAMEGTDRAILRAHEFAGEGVVVLKVCRPGKEMRFDVPVIGPGTMDVLEKVRARALVIEAGRTLLLDEPQLVARARRARMAMVGKA